MKYCLSPDKESEKAERGPVTWSDGWLWMKMRLENRCSSPLCFCQIDSGKWLPGLTFEDFLLWYQTSQDE